MIIKYELEQFAKEIESKVNSLQGKARENALEKLAVLNRVNIEFMEYEKLLRTMAIQHNEMKTATMKMALELRDLKSEVKHLKENING